MTFKDLSNGSTFRWSEDSCNTCVASEVTQKGRLTEITWHVQGWNTADTSETITVPSNQKCY
jgi:hypothetical protein